MTATLMAPSLLSPANTSSDAHWERAYRRLESERDTLADQLGQKFEELHWLRTLATRLTVTDPTTELQRVADDVLPNLRTILRSELVVLVQEASSKAAPHRHVGGTNHAPLICSTSTVDEQAVIELTKQFEQYAARGPIVFNRDANCQLTPLATSASNVVAVPLMHSQARYGWLIALNRVVPPTMRPRAPSDLRSEEFGTYEAGLLATAASMLAGHSRNVELFRAEESLRVSVIETITGALDARDPYTCGHSRRVGELGVEIARRQGFTVAECERMYVTGLLHDVGKIGIPDAILKKADKLTDDEFDVIRQHPAIGHAILSPLKGLAYVLPGVLHHHERVDGRGYPHGLAGDDIPLMARILAVADSYDAMTSSRAYRNAMPSEKAIGILREHAGTQWDRDAVAAFLDSRPATSDGPPSGLP
ncbi:MAG TPA: HD-GYP domain-containing protein [Planctomycetaceae bacterium]|nr:HD-GYP domain-containing protein [Planctomycetaceae bacterium]